jgi:serine/threonine protein kinase
MPPMTGRVIAGRYNLQHPIGRGAMGVVWRARDQILDRDVAVKEVVISSLIGEEERRNAYQRTLREARTAARLSHRGLVAVYDVAEEDGRPWIVMELVPSRSLDQVLTVEGRLAALRVARIGQQLLSALAAAHLAGVLHRDVKPSNVLIATDRTGTGWEERAVLTDFGIAQFEGDPRLTQTGMVMGSPGFTAPERIRGADATPASDLWSLGATLYAAVEGRGPYEARGGAITTMSAIINEDAPIAAHAGRLAQVIAALLRREPAARPSAPIAARMFAQVVSTLTASEQAAPPAHPPTVISEQLPPAAAPVRSGSAPPPPAGRPAAKSSNDQEPVTPAPAEPAASEPAPAGPGAADRASAAAESSPAESSAAAEASAAEASAAEASAAAAVPAAAPTTREAAAPDSPSADTPTPTTAASAAAEPAATAVAESNPAAGEQGAAGPKSSTPDSARVGEAPAAVEEAGACDTAEAVDEPAAAEESMAVDSSADAPEATAAASDPKPAPQATAGDETDPADAVPADAVPAEEVAAVEAVSAIEAAATPDDVEHDHDPVAADPVAAAEPARTADQASGPEPVDAATGQSSADSTVVDPGTNDHGSDSPPSNDRSAPADRTAAPSPKPKPSPSFTAAKPGERPAAPTFSAARPTAATAGAGAGAATSPAAPRPDHDTVQAQYSPSLYGPAQYATVRYDAPQSGPANAYAGSGGGSAPYRGRAIQYTPGSGGGRAQRRSRPGRRLVLIIVAVLVAVAIGAGAAIALGHHGSDATAGTHTGATVTNPTTKFLSVNALNAPSSVVPAGWSTHSVQPIAGKTTGGFTVSVPPGWTEQQKGLGTYFHGPSNMLLEIDLTPHKHPNNMVLEAQSIEQGAIATNRFPGYHRVHLEEVPVRGTKGAFWQFTWSLSGHQALTDDILFTLPTSGVAQQSYAVYIRGLNAGWGTTYLPLFEKILHTFQTIPPSA